MPAPDLVRPPVPPMAPAKLVAVAWSTVRLPSPRVTTPPVPESAPTVWPLPFSMSKLPPLTMSAVVVARLPPLPSRSVPASTVVSPV